MRGCKPFKIIGSHRPGLIKQPGSFFRLAVSFLFHALGAQLHYFIFRIEFHI
jgi:hypothetical protein